MKRLYLFVLSDKEFELIKNACSDLRDVSINRSLNSPIKFSYKIRKLFNKLRKLKGLLDDFSYEEQK